MRKARTNPMELTMTRLLLAMALAGAAAAPGLCMPADTMACNDFTMLDDAAQTQAMQAEGGMMGGAMMGEGAGDGS